MHIWFVRANNLFNKKKKGNATWITVVFLRLGSEIKRTDRAEIRAASILPVLGGIEPQHL